MLKKTLLKNIPQKSGVYLFLKGKKILYIGRAVNLKKRLESYFSKNIDPKIDQLIKEAEKIEFQTTDTLLEAVILEANLIKKHWPKYNIREKDDRSFVYLIIPQTDFPKPTIIRQRELKKFINQKAKIFGPFKSASILKEALKILRRIFPFSTCKKSKRPCFYYQLKMCPGLCFKEIKKSDYQKNIKNLILIFEGKKKQLLKKLKKENPEKAQVLTHLQDVSLIQKEIEKPIFLKRIEAYDISHFAGKETYGALVVFENNDFQKSSYRLFKIKTAQKDDLNSLKEVLLRRFNHKEWPFPDLILIDGGQSQISYLFKILKEIKINLPLIGISKYQNDKLIFSKNIKKPLKELLSQNKNILIKIRNEAHRFSNTASKKSRKLSKLLS